MIVPAGYIYRVRLYEGSDDDNMHTNPDQNEDHAPSFARGER